MPKLTAQAADVEASASCATVAVEQRPTWMMMHYSVMSNRATSLSQEDTELWCLIRCPVRLGVAIRLSQLLYTW